jgi:hypothetical protein
MNESASKKKEISKIVDQMKRKSAQVEHLLAALTLMAS